MTEMKEMKQLMFKMGETLQKLVGTQPVTTEQGSFDFFSKRKHIHTVIHAIKDFRFRRLVCHLIWLTSLNEHHQHQQA